MVFDYNSKKGFTLLELITIIAILGILIAMIFLAMNPLAQFKKIRDARRQHDLFQIRNALDTYYSDNNSYPDCLPFGSTFSQGNTIYMKKVPRDALCQSSLSCNDDYLYVTDSTHQWFVLFSKQEILENRFSDCKFTCTSLPNFPCYQDRTIINLSEYKYCLFGGEIKKDICPYYAAGIIPFSYYAPTPTLGPTLAVTSTPTQAPSPTFPPTPLPTNTPTPTSTECQNGYFFCACGGMGRTVCNYSSIREPGYTYYCDPTCTINGVNQCGKPC